MRIRKRMYDETPSDVRLPEADDDGEKAGKKAGKEAKKAVEKALKKQEEK